MTDSPNGSSDGSAPEPRTARLRYPARTKVIVVLVLAVAIGGFVVAALATVTGDDRGVAFSGDSGDAADDDGDGDGGDGGGGDREGVEALVPRPGDEVLSQQRFGIDLAPGWTGELVFLPANGPAVPLPEDELEVVEELGQIFYRPGPDKTVERLDGGTNCVTATIWSRVRGREASERVENWCFSVV